MTKILKGVFKFTVNSVMLVTDTKLERPKIRHFYATK